MERYIKEYANAKRRDIESNIFMNTRDKKIAMEQIEKALFYRKSGMLTIDQTIRIILEA